MDALVKVWSLSAPEARHDDAAAYDLAHRLRELPGFRSYALISTGERAVASVAVFESAEQLVPAAVLLDQPIAPAVEPNTARGQVLLRLTAWDPPPVGRTVARPVVQPPASFTR